MKKDSKPLKKVSYKFFQCSEQVHLILKNIHSESQEVSSPEVLLMDEVSVFDVTGAAHERGKVNIYRFST